MRTVKKLLAIALFGCSSIALAQADQNKLKTQSINEIGLTVSSYKYTEPNLTDLTGTSMSVTMKAVNYGIEYQGTLALNEDFYLLGQADYNNGSANYSGSGTLNSVPQFYYNFKGAVGHDFTFDNFVISPYIGYGYRYLSQSGGGMTSSTGAGFYDRQSTYNYIPIGVIHRMAVNDKKATLVTTFEYDYLISGSQYSGLSALNGTRNGVTYAGIPNATNSQNSGYGLNLSVMYKEDSWGVGPYVKYWNIGQSNTTYGTFTKNGAGYTAGVYEPANNTMEYGVKAIYRF
jgi:hypothetical protein